MAPTSALRRLASLSLIAVLGASAAPATDPLMGPGISRELAAKRASELSGVRYDLTLSLASTDTARGSVVVHFTLAKRSDVILDFRGPWLAHIVVNGSSTSTVQNGAHLRIPGRAVHPGENVVRADFEALIAPAGASIIKFHDDRDGNDYLYTLLVPSDANALFPCFDQPDLKARLALTLVVPEKWRALANGITEHVDTAKSSGLATYRFHQTDPLPTYLFAFAAGPWRSSPVAPARPTSGCAPRARATSRWTRCRRRSARH